MNSIAYFKKKSRKKAKNERNSPIFCVAQTSGKKQKKLAIFYTKLYTNEKIYAIIERRKQKNKRVENYESKKRTIKG